MGDIKTQLVHGVLWTAISRYAGIVVQIFVTAILARLLSPAEFGIVAVCMVAIAFFDLFTDMGIGAAVVQRQDLEQEDHDHLFSFSIYFGVVLTVLFSLVAFPISHWYGEESLAFYLQLLGLMLLFKTFNMLPNALLMKAKMFRFVAIRTLIIQVATGVIACAGAFCGWGIYALLVSPILTSIVTYIVNRHYVPLRFHIRVDLGPLRKIFSYSFYQLAFNLVNYFSRNLDKILTGKYLSMTDLGFYEKSYRLVLMPMQNITGVINPVIQPVLAEYQNDKRLLGEYLLKILRVLNMVCFPLSVVAFFCAKEIIVILFGSQWYAAVPCFQILCLSIGFQAANYVTGAFYQVANAMKLLFWGGTLCAVENILGFIIAIHYWGTIESVAIAVCIVYTVTFFQTYMLLFGIVYKDFLKAFFKSLLQPVVVCMVLAATLLPTMMMPIDNMWATASCKIILFGVVLLSAYHISGFATWTQIKEFIAKRKSKALQGSDEQQ